MNWLWTITNNSSGLIFIESRLHLQICVALSTNFQPRDLHGFLTFFDMREEPTKMII